MRGTNCPSPLRKRWLCALFVRGVCLRWAYWRLRIERFFRKVYMKNKLEMKFMSSRILKFDDGEPHAHVWRASPETGKSLQSSRKPPEQVDREASSRSRLRGHNKKREIQRINKHHRHHSFHCKSLKQTAAQCPQQPHQAPTPKLMVQPNPEITTRETKTANTQSNKKLPCSESVDASQLPSTIS